MIPISSSYGRISSGWRVLFPDDSDIMKKMLNATVSPVAKYGDRTAAMPPEFLAAVSSEDFRSTVGIFRHRLIAALLRRIPQWGALFDHFSTHAFNQGSNAAFKFKMLPTSSAEYDKENLVGGLATLAYLRGNRYSRNVYSDITIACVLIRENYEFFPDPEVLKTDESSPFGGPFFLFGNGYHPDPDFEDKSGFAPAVGMGQRHPNRWKATCKYLGIDKPEIVSGTYLSLGLQPWWLQVMLMQADLFMLSTKYPWFVTSPGTSGNTLSSAALPYYYAGNPGYHRLPLKEIDELPENAGVQKFLVQNGLPILSDLLLKGVPLDTELGLVLFNKAPKLAPLSNVSESIMMQHLIAGVNDDTDLFGPTAAQLPRAITSKTPASIRKMISDLGSTSEEYKLALVKDRLEFEKHTTSVTFKFDYL